MNIYSIKNKGVAGNIWKYSIIAITNKRSYLTFFSIFLLTLPNTTAQTIGLISFVGQLFGFLFEVPSGYISDKIGHKKALIIGKFALALGTFSLIFADSAGYFFFSQVLMSLGFAMQSGTFSAFFEDTLTYIGKESQFSSIMGKIKSIGYFVPVLFIVGLPVIAQYYGYQLALVVAFGIDCIGLVAVMSLQNPPKEKSVGKIKTKTNKNVLKEYFKIGWLQYVIFGQIMFAFLFAATVGFKNVYQESIGLSVATLGVLWGISRIGISGLLLLNGWFKRNLSLKKIILIQGLTFTVALSGVSLLENKWLVAVCFILGTMAMWGFSSVKSHFYLEYIKGSEYKASFLSINTFIGKIISAGFSLLMGYLVLQKSYEFGFMVFGVMLLMVTILGLFLMKNKNNRA